MVPNEDKDVNNSIFEHDALEYKGGARLLINTGNDAWLPYFEKWVLVFWLFVISFITFVQLGTSLSRFTQLMIASLGIVAVFIGMNIAFRRSGKKSAVTITERDRRRWGTARWASIWQVLWIVVLNGLL